MASISVSSLILLITSMIIAVGVVGVFTTSVNDLSQAIGDSSVQVSDDVRTSVEIISDGDSDNVYDADTETTTVLVKNTGAQSLDPVPTQIEVLLDDELVSAENLELTVLGDGDPDTWERDEVLRVIVTEVLEVGHHEVRVIVGGDEERLSFRIDGDETPSEPTDPAFFEVTELEATPDPVDAGHDVEIETTITNTGDVQDSQEVIFRVDEDQIGDPPIVTLDGDESTELSRTYTTEDDDIGEIRISVETDDDSDDTDVTVRDPEDEEDT